MPLRHTPTGTQYEPVCTDVLLRRVRVVIDAFKDAGELRTVRVLLATRLDHATLVSVCDQYRAIGEHDAGVTAYWLACNAGELRRRGEGAALDALIDGELEDLKIETLARTPGALDASGYIEPEPASAAGAAG